MWLVGFDCGGFPGKERWQVLRSGWVLSMYIASSAFFSCSVELWISIKLIPQAYRNTFCGQAEAPVQWIYNKIPTTAWRKCLFYIDKKLIRNYIILPFMWLWAGSVEGTFRVWMCQEMNFSLWVFIGHVLAIDPGGVQMLGEELLFAVFFRRAQSTNSNQNLFNLYYIAIEKILFPGRLLVMLLKKWWGRMDWY